MSIKERIRDFSLHIGGEWIDTPDQDVIRLPYDGTPVASVPRAGVEIVDRAVAAAREGAKAMAALTNAERADLLVRIAGLLDRDSAEFAHLLSSETGKPIKEARIE